MFTIPKEKRALAATLSVVVIAISSFVLWRMLAPPDHRESQERFVAVGEFAAETLAGLIPAGSQVKLLIPDTASYVLLNRQIDAFLLGMAEHELQLATQILVPIDEEYWGIYLDAGMPADKFLDLIGKHEDIDCVVSFAGVPFAHPEQNFVWPDDLPPVLVVGAATYGLKDLLAKGVISWAIAPRMEAWEAAIPESETLRDWYERHYSLYTADNADLLM